jgi:hypothetical protein
MKDENEDENDDEEEEEEEERRGSFVPLLIHQLRSRL